MMLCIFPDCTDGDTSLEAYDACDLCSLRPRQRCPIQFPRACLATRCQLYGICEHNRRLDEAAQSRAQAVDGEGNGPPVNQ
jgi:hypothetical protein